MSMYLKFRIGKDKRKLVPINGFELNDADSNNPQWIQGRQNEDGGRQVFVDLEDEDGSPVNLTGANAIFKGVLPGGEYKIWDHKHSTIIDAQAGRFRYTFPKRAMAIAGSYKQAFFEIYREGNKLATLEFNFEVLADLVEENIIPSDYITPFEDLYGKLKEYLVKFNGDFDTAMAQWKKDVADLITELNTDISGINLTISEIKSQLSALEDKIKADGLLTKSELDVFMSAFINSETLGLKFNNLGKRAEFYDKSLAQSGVNVSWFNPPMDGVNDDSVAIQAAINFADKNGYKKVIIPDGNYLMLENIYLKSNLNLVLGHGTVINSKYKWLVLKNGMHDVKVSGGTFRGDFGQKQAFMITLHHAKNCSFENINFEECLIAEHVFDIGGSQNINIDHCNFSGKLANPNRDFVEAIQVDYSIYSGLGYKDEDERKACDGAPCSDITVTNCRFTPVYDEEGNIKYPAPMPFGNHDQFEGMYHRNIIFENNYIKDCILSAGDRGTDLRNGWLHFGDVKGLTVKGNRFVCTNGTKVGAIRIMQNELGHKASDATIDAPTLSHIKIDDLSDIQILDNQFEGFDATYSNEDQYGIIRIYGVKTQYSNTIVKQVVIRGNSFTDCYPKDVDPTIAPYGIDCIVLHRVDGIISNNSANNIRRLSWSDDSWLNISDNKIVNAYYVPIVSNDRYAIITSNLIHTCYGGIVTNNSSYASNGWDILKINGNIIVDVLGDLGFSDKYKSATIMVSGSGKNDITNNTLVSSVSIPYGIKIRSDITTDIGSIVKISDNVIKGYTEAYNNVNGLSQHDNL